jgi:hypothetical protein
MAIERSNATRPFRELQNVMERSVVLANGSECVGVGDLPDELKDTSKCEQIIGSECILGITWCRLGL